MKYEKIVRDRNNNMICGKCGNIIMKHVNNKGSNSSAFIPTSERPIRVVEMEEEGQKVAVRCDKCGSDCVE